MKWNVIKYKRCLYEVKKICIIGCKSVDDNVWICLICDLNLIYGKLLSCLKISKKNFLGS